MAALSFKALEELFEKHLIQLLGYLDKEQSQGPVRYFYQEDSQPFHSYGKDMCYFYIQPVDDPINRQLNTYYAPLDETHARQINSYTRVLELVINFYGPGAYDKAVLLRMDLLEPGKNYALAKQGLFVIPDIAEPFLSWESYNNRWWPRTDLSIRYNNTVTDERHKVGYLSGAEIVVVSEEMERLIEVKDNKEGE